MTRALRLLGPIFLSAVGAGCSTVESGPDPMANRCPPSGEFGNYGCAVLLVRLLGPDGLPVQPSTRPKSRVAIALTQISPHDAIGSYAMPVTDAGWQDVQITRVVGPRPADPDTVTVQLQAFWWDEPVDDPSGRLRVYAADSVRRQVRLVPMGARSSRTRSNSAFGGCRTEYLREA